MTWKCSVSIWNDSNSSYPSSWSTDNNRTNPTASKQRRRRPPTPHRRTHRPRLLLLSSTPWSWSSAPTKTKRKIPICQRNRQHQRQPKPHHSLIHCPTKRSTVQPPRLQPVLRTHWLHPLTPLPIRNKHSSISVLTDMLPSALPSKCLFHHPIIKTPNTISPHHPPIPWSISRPVPFSWSFSSLCVNATQTTLPGQSRTPTHPLPVVLTI